MKSWWSNTRPNGQPIDAGTFCRVIDLEDGTHPIFTYGTTMDQVLEKIERQNGNAQLALARRASIPPQNAVPAHAEPIAPRKRMTADETMQATTDLQNPAKAGEALTRLVEDSTGVDLRQIAIQNFVRIATRWEQDHPNFYAHPGNKRLLADQAKAHTGGDIARVTAEILTQAFTELQNGGYLLEAPSEYEPQPSITPSSFPAEMQVQRTERPRRSASNYSTGIPGNRLRAAQTAQPRTLKYSASDIEAMPLSKSRALLERADPDYLASVDAYERSRMATAS
jgi:hypothetical protein